VGQGSVDLAVADRVREREGRALALIEHRRIAPVRDGGQLLLAEPGGHEPVVVPLVCRCVADSRAQDHEFPKRPRRRHQVIAE